MTDLSGCLLEMMRCDANMDRMRDIQRKSCSELNGMRALDAVSKYGDTLLNSAGWPRPA